MSEELEKGDYVMATFNGQIYRIARIRSGQVDLVGYGTEEDEPLRYPDVFSCPVSRVVVNKSLTAFARAIENRT